LPVGIPQKGCHQGIKGDRLFQVRGMPGIRDDLNRPAPESRRFQAIQIIQANQLLMFALQNSLKALNGHWGKTDNSIKIGELFTNRAK
jgi:hypothetical protein